jgi:chromosome segregation ATPase
MRRFPVLLILALLYIFSLDILVAQSYTNAYWLEPWFLESRFKLTDQDGDGFVDREELGYYEQEWRFFLINEYYLEADLNGDNLLSEDEILRQVGTAHDFRIKEEGGMIRRLSFEYPYLNRAKPVYFKRHPKVAEKLLENLSWVRSNPEIVQKLILDEAWLKKNPAVLRAFHCNLTALAEFPGLANKVYAYRLTQRQCSDQYEWRISHLNMLEEHRNVLNKVLRLNLRDEQISEESLRHGKLAQSADYRPVLEPKEEEDNHALKEEAAQLESELLALIQRLQQENQRLKSAQDQLRRQVQALRGALANVNAAASQNELDQLRRKIAEISRSKTELESQLSRLALNQQGNTPGGSSEELRQLRFKVNALSEQNLRYQGLLSGNRDSLRMENILQETQILQLQQVIVRMGAELDQRPETPYAARSKNGVPAADITPYKAQITRINNRLELTEAENARLNSSLNQLSVSLEEAKRTRSQLQDSLILLESEYEIQVQQLKQIVANRGEVASQYEALSEQNRSQARQIQEMATTISSLEARLEQKSTLASQVARQQNLQSQYTQQLAKQRSQLDSLTRLSQQQNLQMAQLQKQAGQPSNQSVRVELEQQYMARLQRQRSQTDSLLRLNQELATQVDDLQMAMVMGEGNDAQNEGLNAEAVEKLEQRYQAQIQRLQAQIKTTQTQGQFDANTINQLQQSFAQKLGEQTAQNRSLITERDSLLNLNARQQAQISALSTQGSQIPSGPDPDSQNQIATLEEKLRNRDLEIQALQQRLAEQDQVDEELQETVNAQIAGEKVRLNQLFNQMRDSLLDVQSQLENQIYALESEKELRDKHAEPVASSNANPTSDLETQLRNRDIEVQAAQAEIQSLQRIIEEKNQAEAALQERTMELLTSEREAHDYAFNRMRDSLLEVQNYLGDQLYELQQEKTWAENQVNTQSLASAALDSAQAQMELMRMELELAREVEDSIMAISMRQLRQIDQLKNERDTLIQGLRTRDRTIESYISRMKIQQDSLDHLLSLQNRAYSDLNSRKESDQKRSLLLQQRIASLEYDNEKMLERMESSMSRNDELELEMSKLKAHNQALIEKNKELKSRRNKSQNVVATTLQEQLEQLEREKTDLSIERKSLAEQLKALEDFIAQTRQAETRLKREVQQQKSVNARLFNQVDSLENELEQFHSFNWPDSIDYYREKLLIAQASTENQRGMNIAQGIDHNQEIDSLQQALLVTRQEIANLEQGQNFDLKRLRKLEKREADLNQRNAELKRQEELIEQQSRMIEGRLKSLSEMEKRYLDLLEREKQLQLLEQQLKQQPGYREAKRALKGQ